MNTFALPQQHGMIDWLRWTLLAPNFEAEIRTREKTKRGTTMGMGNWITKCPFVVA